MGIRTAAPRRQDLQQNMEKLGLITKPIRVIGEPDTRSCDAMVELKDNQQKHWVRCLWVANLILRLPELDLNQQLFTKNTDLRLINFAIQLSGYR